MEDNFEAREARYDDEVVVTPRALSSLESAARWARTLAIIGFIGLGLMVLGGLFLMVGGAMSSGYSYRRGPDIPFALMGILYWVMAVIYFFPILYLYRFGSEAKEAVRRRDKNVLEMALNYLQMHYQYLGILTIVLLSLYGLVLLIMLMAAAAGGFR